MVTPWLAQTPSPTPSVPEGAGDAANLVLDTIRSLVAAFVARLPLIGIGVIVLIIGVLLAGWLSALSVRALKRTSADQVVVGLSSRLVRLVAITAVALLALSVMGVEVGAVLAGLGIVGLALAFALQNILENFVAGILLLVRKPFRAGDQIRTGEFEGTVTEIDLRVTRIIDYDGETVLVPNADVFTNALINLTQRGKRRTTVTIGIDYRDDHDAARAILTEAVRGVEGVLDAPGPDVLLTELGDSSVNFDILYWTLPDIRSVRQVQDRVLSAAKSAVEAAGMTIPWPIRTLVVDDPDGLVEVLGRRGGNRRPPDASS